MAEKLAEAAAPVAEAAVENKGHNTGSPYVRKLFKQTNEGWWVRYVGGNY